MSNSVKGLTKSTTQVPRLVQFHHIWFYGCPMHLTCVHQVCECISSNSSFTPAPPGTLEVPATINCPPCPSINSMAFLPFLTCQAVSLTCAPLKQKVNMSSYGLHISAVVIFWELDHIWVWKNARSNTGKHFHNASFTAKVTDLPLSNI